MNTLKMLGSLGYGIMLQANAAAQAKNLPLVFNPQNPGDFLNNDYRVVSKFKWSFPFVAFTIIYHAGKEDQVILGTF